MYCVTSYVYIGFVSAVSTPIFGSKYSFLARNSVAVAPAFAHCTNRCTRRKVTVTAQSTKRENRKMKKRSQHENTKLPIRSPRAALLLLSQSFWWGADEQSQDKPSETKFISIVLVRSIRKRRRLHGRRWTGHMMRILFRTVYLVTAHRLSTKRIA